MARVSSLALAAAGISAVAAQSDNVVSILMPYADSNGMHASIITAAPTATSYWVSCPSGVPSSDCGIVDGMSVVYGPSTWEWTTTAGDWYTSVAHCQLNPSADTGVCTETQIFYSFEAVQTRTITNFATGLSPVTITAGPTPSATSSVSPSTTATDTAEPTATGTAEPTATDTAEPTATGRPGDDIDDEEPVTKSSTFASFTGKSSATAAPGGPGATVTATTHTTLTTCPTPVGTGGVPIGTGNLPHFPPSPTGPSGPGVTNGVPVIAGAGRTAGKVGLAAVAGVLGAVFLL